MCVGMYKKQIAFPQTMYGKVCPASADDRMQFTVLDVVARASWSATETTHRCGDIFIV